MSVRSMTGYGRASGIVGGKEISIDIKSVNHRYFDFNCKISKDYLFLEDKLKARVNGAISRGKIDLFLFIDSGKNESYDVEVNESLALGYVDAFKLLSKSLKIKNDLTASFLVKLPDVVKLKKRELDETEIENAVLAVLDKAIDSYDSMRNTEGAKLREDVEKNLDIILETVERIEELAPLSVEIYKNRLAAKMKDALEGKEYDEQRLITEVAIFADKVDVGEETVRLKSHISQFKELMDSDSPSIGKKLDFIVQEMNREINTTGSKCNSVEITKLVVDTKSVIEKIREQIQNIE